MDGKLTALLTDLAEGRLSIAEAAAQIAPREESESGFDNLGFARVDVDRFERQGVPEVVYGEGKSSDEISSIVGALLQAEQSVFVTRVSDEKVRDIHPIYPQLKQFPSS